MDLGALWLNSVNFSKLGLRSILHNSAAFFANSCFLLHRAIFPSRITLQNPKKSNFKYCIDGLGTSTHAFISLS